MNKINARRIRNIALAMLAAFTITSLISKSAMAVLLDFQYSGKITTLNDDGAFINKLSVGDLFSGLFTLDTEVQDSFTSSPDVGFYVFSPQLTAFSAIIAGGLWAATSQSSVSAVLFNDNNLPMMRDLFVLQAFGIDVGTDTGGFVSSAMRLDFGDNSMSAFVDDQLPLNLNVDTFDSGKVIDGAIFPPVTTLFPSLSIDVVVEEINQEPKVSIGYQLVGQIQDISLLSPTMIPAPSSLLLILIGLSCVIVFRHTSNRVLNLFHGHPEYRG